MSWEEIVPGVGARIGNGGVTVAWRKTSQRGAPVLCITLSAALATEMGMVRGKTWLMVQRDRLAGKMRVSVAKDTAGWRPQWRSTGKATHAWCACVYIPLEDVREANRKPAQTVAWEKDGADAVVIRLPSWACPPVKIETRRAA